jgi:peptide/nickel transport system substrate-binding protein
VWKVVTDQTTAANLLLTGGLDVAVMAGPDVDRLLGEKSLTVLKAPIFYATTLLYNQTPGAVTNDVNLRKAIAMAIDRSTFNQAAYKGLGIPTVGFNFLPGGPSGTCWSNAWNNLAPKYDLDKANALLNSSGYRVVDGKRTTPDGKRLTIRILSNSGLQGQAGEYLLAQMGKLGIDASLLNVTGTTYTQAILGVNFDIALSQNSGMTTDPAVTMVYFFGKPITEGGLNYSQIGREVPSWAAAMTAASHELGAAMCKQYDKATRIMYTNMLLDPLAAPVAFIFKRNGIPLDVGPRTLDPINIGRPKS